MLNLLYKDWSIIKKTRALYFGLLYFFFVIPSSQNGSFISGKYLSNFFFIFVIYLLFTYLASYDYKYNGLTFMSAFPVSKKDIVKSRYTFVGLAFIFCLVLLIAVKTVIQISQGHDASFSDIITFEQAGMLFSSFALFFSIILPVYFKYGYQKIRWFMFIAMIISAIIPSIISETGADLNYPFFAGAAIIGSYICYMISYNLSIHFLESQDL